jgi:hypothetical protein
VWFWAGEEVVSVDQGWQTKTEAPLHGAEVVHRGSLDQAEKPAPPAAAAAAAVDVLSLEAPWQRLQRG